MTKKVDKREAFAWVSYMLTHERKEMERFLKFGTPSDRLIELSSQPVLMTLSYGQTKLITFPLSLNKRAGQQLAFRIASRVSLYIKTIPFQAHELLQEIKTTLRVRRKDTQSNILMVAEAILHRAASEFKHEVLFSFDSIITWVESAYNKTLGYLTIRRALELLEEKGYLQVNEWGKRGNRSKCTKIQFIPLHQEYILTYTSEVDDWLLYLDHAMTKVYARESTTRQDVLEAQIHAYADFVTEKSLAEEQIDDFFKSGRRLIPVSDDKIAEQVIEIEEQEIWDDVYIDRLLGRLVQPLQANGSSVRESISSQGRPVNSS